MDVLGLGSFAWRAEAVDFQEFRRVGEESHLLAGAGVDDRVHDFLQEVRQP
jgi:hypothetical protein